MSVERRSTMRDRRGRFAALLLCATLALTACAASFYAGIPLAAGAAAPDLQSLARLAQVGEKQAQLELGIRYEEGRGLPVDLERAERLYRLAASDSGGSAYVYSPATPGARAGRVNRVSLGPRREGLPAAAERLRALRRLEPDQ